MGHSRLKDSRSPFFYSQSYLPVSSKSRKEEDQQILMNQESSCIKLLSEKKCSHYQNLARKDLNDSRKFGKL